YYWNKNGGLAQQGYPISDEFTEKSDLDGKSYRVQYFERAVFEMHPENPAPNDVLLSQLGTFQFKSKYPTGQVPQGGPTPPPAPPSSPVPTPPPSGGAETVTFKGTGETKTRPFFLSGGSYVSDWSASDTTTVLPVVCIHVGSLHWDDPVEFVTYGLGF